MHMWLQTKWRKISDTYFIPQHVIILNNTVFSFHFPELRSSSCGNPGIPPKGILNGTQFNIGDKIRYRCVTGYVLDGHSLLTCVTNAAGVSVWDFPVPICRGKDEDLIILTAYDDCWCQFFSQLYNVTVGYHGEYMMLSTYFRVPSRNLEWAGDWFILTSCHLISTSYLKLIAF